MQSLRKRHARGSRARLTVVAAVLAAGAVAAPNVFADKPDNPGAHKQQSSGHGDCKHDNGGGHNGYDCQSSGGGDTGGDGGSTGEQPAPSGTQTSTTSPERTAAAAAQPVAPVTTTVGSGAAPQGGPARRCASRRSFTIHLPRRLRSARVYVNGRRVAVRRGRRLKGTVNLRGLPKGAFTVRIVGRRANGRRVVAHRRYHTCVPRRG